MTGKATVLVVEDDLALMHAIRDILELQGYHVLTASNGADALELLRNRRIAPDVIISDIMMPRMDGYAFFRAVRQESRWTGIPFVFMTAKGEKTDVRVGKLLGADDYLIKPVDPEDLVIAVAAKLRRRIELEELQLTQVSDVKRKILTILNHEFRTPMTYIVAYGDMLNRDADTLSVDEMKMFLSGINAGADRLRRLVENFILLVELETGDAAETFRLRQHPTTDYRSLLTFAVNYMHTAAAAKNIRVSFDVPEGLPAVSADTDYLRAAVVRLLENAIKFSKDNSTVELSTYTEGGHVCIRVTDHGRGIPEDELSRIFEPFYQVDRHIHEDQGAGSGLTIIRHIATLHSGYVDVQSKIGEGSAFTLHLPIHMSADS
jgi:two-component system, sensor histidine kinase and response regulator